jgi:hypothetical protein
MNSLAILKDTSACPSVVWTALKYLYSEDIENWEPETFQIELTRTLREPQTEALISKILGAQTIVTTCYWASRYEILFGFALVCDGVPVSFLQPMEPTVEQLCWAFIEINALAKKTCTLDEGTDPDEIDAAIAVVGLNEGFVTLPSELSFAEHALENLSFVDPELRRQVKSVWDKLDEKPVKTLDLVGSKLQEDPLGVALKKLIDARKYIQERIELRVRQNAILNCD